MLRAQGTRTSYSSIESVRLNYERQLVLGMREYWSISVKYAMGDTREPLTGPVGHNSSRSPIIASRRSTRLRLPIGSVAMTIYHKMSTLMISNLFFTFCRIANSFHVEWRTRDICVGRKLIHVHDFRNSTSYCLIEILHIPYLP